MDGTVFFYFGGALVLAALAISYIGIKGKASFPPNNATMAGALALFAVVVVGTAAYAVANAREEQETRNEEHAAEEAEAAAEEPGSPPAPPASPGGPGGAPPGAPAPPAEAETFEVASPEDGGLSFAPDSFEAKAGTITLAYENPSPIPHNINIEDAAGETLKESADVTGGEVELTAPLVPGEYTFYCSIEGHRESGMEGTLTVE